MTYTTPIDASKARNDFFNILMRAYKGESFLVKKSGIPMAKIIKADNYSEADIISFAGKLKNINEKKAIKDIYRRRKDSVIHKRKIPKI